MERVFQQFIQRCRFNVKNKSATIDSSKVDQRIFYQKWQGPYISTKHIAVRNDRRDSEKLQMGNFVLVIIKGGIKMKNDHSANGQTAAKFLVSSILQRTAILRLLWL